MQFTIYSAIFIISLLTLSPQVNTLQLASTQIAAHSSGISALTVLADGSAFLTTSNDKILKMWSTTLKLLLQVQQNDGIIALETDPISQNVFICTAGGSIEVINYQSLIPMSNIPAINYPNSGMCYSIVFGESNSGKFYAAGVDFGKSPSYHVYNSTNLNELTSESKVTNFSTNSQIKMMDIYGNSYLAVGGFKGTSAGSVEVYNILNGIRINTLLEAMGAITDMEFDENGRLFISSQDMLIRIYNFSSNLQDYVLTNSINVSLLGVPAAFTTKLSSSIIVAINQTLYSFSSSNFSLLNNLSVNTTGSISTMEAYQDKMLLIGTSNGDLFLLSPSTQTSLLKTKYIVLASVQGSLIMLTIVIACILKSHCQRSGLNPNPNQPNSQSTNLLLGNNSSIMPISSKESIEIEDIEHVYQQKERNSVLRDQHNQQPNIYLNGDCYQQQPQNQPKPQQTEKSECKTPRTPRTPRKQNQSATLQEIAEMEARIRKLRRKNKSSKQLHLQDHQLPEQELTKSHLLEMKKQVKADRIEPSGRIIKSRKSSEVKNVSQFQGDRKYSQES